MTTLNPNPAAAVSASTSTPQDALLILLQIEREARRAESLHALRFTAVNAPRQIIEYQQAILWHPIEGVLALSGLSTVDSDAPFVRWLNHFLKQQSLQRGSLMKAELSEPDQQDWQQWLPEHAWIEPLTAAAAFQSAATPASSPWLILVRGRAWSVPEQTLLAELGEALGYAYSAFRPRRAWHWPHKMMIAGGVLLAAMLIPVHQTVVSPVEVVPVEPVMVRVSLDGVIDHFHIQPNQKVTAGQPLFDLDPTKLKGSLDVAQNALAVAEADYRQVSQQALSDPRAKALVAIRRGEVERRLSEVRYLEQLTQRLQIKAPVDGIAVLGDVNDWLGKAVTVGEKVMDIADPNHVEFLIRLPVEAMMPLPDQAAVDVYLNIAPDDALPATVSYLSYQADLTPEGVLAYRIKATLAGDKALPRVGLRGIARLYGERVILGYWLFRKPWSWLRQWLGGW